MQTPLNRTDLQAFIDTHHLSAVILPMAVHTATVDDAASALGVTADMIIKSLVFMADSTPILVVNNGQARVDRKKLADYLGMSRKRVKFATARQAPGNNRLCGGKHAAIRSSAAVENPCRHRHHKPRDGIRRRGGNRCHDAPVNFGTTPGNPCRGGRHFRTDTHRLKTILS